MRDETTPKRRRKKELGKYFRIKKKFDSEKQILLFSAL
jgi:hypothetical protein